MGEVVPFARAVLQAAAGPWTHAERLELARLAAAITRDGRVGYDVASGQGDGGEPWFAISMPTSGETLLHVARIGGRFIVHHVADDLAEEGHDLRAMVRRAMRDASDSLGGLGPGAAVLLLLVQASFEVSAAAADVAAIEASGALPAAVAQDSPEAATDADILADVASAGSRGDLPAAEPSGTAAATVIVPSLHPGLGAGLPVPVAATGAAGPAHFVPAAFGDVLPDGVGKAVPLALRDGGARPGVTTLSAGGERRSGVDGARIEDMAASAKLEPKPAVVIGDVIAGETVDDVLFGGDGNDYLLGDAGNDHLDGGVGHDHLDGGIGHDHLVGGTGSDTLVGGIGNDTLIGDDEADADPEDGDDVGEDPGDPDTDTAATDPVANTKLPVNYADKLNGEEGDDELSGGRGNDTVSGGEGRDKLYGGLGDDILYGQADDDELWGGVGEDLLKGGLGNDTLVGGIGNDTMFGGAGRDSLSGEPGDDRLMGGLGSDTLNGGIGNDALFGDTGRDTLIGGDGADRLFGGDGRDALLGGEGNDTIVGGGGADAIDGGAGNDTIVVDGGTYARGGMGEDLFLIDFSGLAFDAAGRLRHAIIDDFDSSEDQYRVLDPEHTSVWELPTDGEKAFGRLLITWGDAPPASAEAAMLFVPSLLLSQFDWLP